VLCSARLPPHHPFTHTQQHYHHHHHHQPTNPRPCLISRRGIFDSLDKLRWLEQTAAELSVRTGAACLLCPSGRRVFVVPLYSWYHASFDTEPDLPAAVTAPIYAGRVSFLERWSDFRFCKWPETLCPREV
jgi:hypothetical protein